MRVAVTSRSFSRHKVLRAELLQRYPDVTFNDAGTQLKGGELVRFLAGHERAIIALEEVDEALLAQLPELKVISKFGVGLDKVDLQAMQRRGIRLGWAGGVNRRSVAELVVALSICLLRHVVSGNDLIRSGGWQQLMGRQLSDRTVGIVGCGHIGQEVARLMRAFGCRVMAHDIRDLSVFYVMHGIQDADLEGVLRTADVVTLHLPLDDTTRNILSAERLSWMRPDAILINAARGGLIDQEALAAVLRERRLAGAAFDVFDTEPPGSIDLLRLPNFIATPHIGGHAEEAVLAMGRAAIEGLGNAGDPLTVSRA